MSTKLGTLTLDLVAKISNFSEPMKKAGDTAQKESKRIESSVNSAKAAIIGLGATALAGLTVSAVIESADAYTQMAARIRNATKDTEEYDLVQKRLLNTANGTYRALGEAQEVYLGLSGGLKELGYNTQQVLDISDSLSYSFVHNATSADKAQSAMSAYGKVLDKGKVDADAWFTIIAGVPNILDDVAKATGKSSKEIRKLGAEGKLAAKDLHEGFLLSRDANQELANNMENSFADGLVSVKNGFEVLVGKANMATGATSTLASGLVTVGEVLALASENLDVLAVAGGTAAVVLTVKMAPALIADTTLKIANTLATRNKAIADYEVAKSNLSATVAMVRAMGVTNAQTAAMITNANAAYKQAAATKAAAVAGTSLTSILGGPVGLILTVATVAASYALFRDKTKDSTVSLIENNKTVEEAIKKYTELDEIGRARQLIGEREELDELTSAYERLNTELLGYAWKMTRSTDMTSAQATEFNALVGRYKAGDITLKQLSDAVSKNTNFTQKQKDEFIKHASSVRDASDAMSTQKTLVDQIIVKNSQLSKTHSDVTNAVNRQKQAYEALTDQQKKVYDSVDQRLQREKYINLNVSSGSMSRAEAEHFADKRIEAGIPFNEKLSKIMFDQVKADYQLTQGIKAREESEKKITEQKKKQQEIAEKTVKSQTIDSLIARGEGNYNSFNKGKAGDSVGKKLNLTGMTVGQIRQMQNSGEIFAVGKYQNIPTTLQGAIDAGIVSTAEKFNADVQERIVQNYLLTAKKGRKSLEDYITGKGDDLIGANIDAAKEFASVAHPATGKSYYAGVGNNKASISAKEAQNALMASRYLYATAIASGKSAEEAWKAAFNESFTFVKDSDAQKALEVVLDKNNEIEDEKEKSLARQKTVMQAYYSEEEAMAVANAEARKEIEEAFSGDNEAITKYLLLQEMAYQKDVKAFKEAQHQKAISAYEAIQNPLADMQSIGFNATAQSTLSPMEYQKWQMNNEQQAGYSQLGDTFANAQKAINDSEYISDTEKYAQLEALYETYLQNKAALSEQYAQQDQDLTNQYQAASLAGYGAMFGMMGSMLDAYGDKSSASYKTAFLLQKAFVFSSALLNAKGAVMAAWNDPANTTIWSKMAAAAATVVQTNELMSAIQGVALTGMAHNGIDNVPSEGTWLLDKGERVLNPQQNKDLTSYLANSNRGSSGDVRIQVNVTDSGVSTQSSSSDKKQLGDVIGNAVRAVIRQEKRQGGLLY